MKNIFYLLLPLTVLCFTASCSKLEEDTVSRMKLKRALTDKQYEVVYYESESNISFDSVPSCYNFTKLYIDVKRDIFSTNHGSGIITGKFPQNGVYNLSYNGSRNIQDTANGNATYYNLSLMVQEIKCDVIKIKLQGDTGLAVYLLKRK